MFFTTSPEGITLVNRTECQLASRVLAELPTQGSPSGRKRLFLDAPPHIRVQAKRYGGRVFNTSMALRVAGDMPSQARLAEGATLPPFVPLTLAAVALDNFVNGMLLVAEQQPPRGMPRRQETIAQGSVSAARLFSAWTMRLGGLEIADQMLRRRFEDQLNDPRSGYQASVSRAASRLLESAAQEYRHLGPEEQPSRVAPVSLAEYRNASPVLVEFASYRIINN